MNPQTAERPRIRRWDEVLAAFLFIGLVCGLMFGMFQLYDFLPTDQYYGMRDDPELGTFITTADTTLALSFTAFWLIIYLISFKNMGGRYSWLQWPFIVLAITAIILLAGFRLGVLQNGLLSEPDGRELFWVAFRYQAPHYILVLSIATVGLIFRRSKNQET